VKSGGRLIYATCSLLACENEDRIASFRAQHSDFGILSAAEIWRDVTQTQPPPSMAALFNASPFRTGTDGFFTAILART